MKLLELDLPYIRYYLDQLPPGLLRQRAMTALHDIHPEEVFDEYRLRTSTSEHSVTVKPDTKIANRVKRALDRVLGPTMTTNISVRVRQL